MRRNGFTLIEMMVALTVAAMVALLAHRMFSEVLDASRRAADAQDALARDMNARRWLMEAFGSLDISATSGGFVGRAHAIDFATWERTVNGTLAVNRVMLALVADSLILAGARRIPLATPVRSLDLDYLLEPGANSVWVHEWISPVSAPLAVRLRLNRGSVVDTLLLLIGPRG
ncbi:MAG: prepilin-type N-terminal cleavage/methylation domain-containing protein [Chloroflexi bacterium]|nr:MAG: prepilin-type N-terminal cleavage/methylation domain-containing protein [Chloroflexota bacterium]